MRNSPGNPPGVGSGWSTGVLLLPAHLALQTTWAARGVAPSRGATRPRDPADTTRAPGAWRAGAAPAGVRLKGGAEANSPCLGLRILQVSSRLGAGLSPGAGRLGSRPLGGHRGPGAAAPGQGRRHRRRRPRARSPRPVRKGARGAQPARSRDRIGPGGGIRGPVGARRPATARLPPPARGPQPLRRDPRADARTHSRPHALTSASLPQASRRRGRGGAERTAPVPEALGDPAPGPAPAAGSVRPTAPPLPGLGPPGPRPFRREARLPPASPCEHRGPFAALALPSVVPAQSPPLPRGRARVYIPPDPGRHSVLLKGPQRTVTHPLSFGERWHAGPRPLAPPLAEGQTPLRVCRQSPRAPLKRLRTPVPQVRGPRICARWRSQLQEGPGPPPPAPPWGTQSPASGLPPPPAPPGQPARCQFATHGPGHLPLWGPRLCHLGHQAGGLPA